MLHERYFLFFEYNHMNAALPVGIESYLKEAGFTSTEMFVLRRLVESDSLTIRELGGKSGKSTGVLDQAMKKLISKRIAEKNTINGQPRYSIHSLESIVKWVQKDMDEKKKILDRRHQNFESFIASLKVDKKRPDMEYFHGSEGIKKAYLTLLDTGEELLTQMPVVHLAEEDPFRVFRVDLFRKRQVRKIFHRVLAQDSTLARRFRSRDPFEYRRTLLLPEDQLPITFEKTIAGDIIACINAQDESACLLKYPVLAKAERDAFNALWSRAQALERGDVRIATPYAPIAKKPPCARDICPVYPMIRFMLSAPMAKMQLMVMICA